MSAILSSSDLNDFISPGVACIKPVESFQKPSSSGSPSTENAYEVTTEDAVASQNAPPAQISLTDCLACSGCVTSAEAVLVSLQSHTEVLNTLDAYPSLSVHDLLSGNSTNSLSDREGGNERKLFVASVSPQVRASLAAAYNISETKASYLIDQLLAGSTGLRSGGKHGSFFSYVVDSNRLREACLVLCADEALGSPILDEEEVVPSKPILSSACPGWICYAEKTHPHVLPHLSRLKSPQALTGVFLKSILSKKFHIHPSQIWHLAIMPCFDKKLEASRVELTDQWWSPPGNLTPTSESPSSKAPVRDVDCVITARELLTLAYDRGIHIPSLPLRPLSPSMRPRVPDPILHDFLFPRRKRKYPSSASVDAGTSGGYLYHILKTYQARHLGSVITATRGRNADVVEYTLALPGDGSRPLLKCARYYGFRNIQNLVRKLRPPRNSRLPGAASRRKTTSQGQIQSGSGASEYAYIEVMACPGGCTNGGGQLKPEDRQGFGNQGLAEGEGKEGVQNQREWLRLVDEAYFSAESSSSEAEVDSEGDIEMEDGVNEDAVGESINGISPSQIYAVLQRWTNVTGVPLRKLVNTEYRTVESDVGKSKKGTGGDTERVAALAGTLGGGW